MPPCSIGPYAMALGKLRLKRIILREERSSDGCVDHFAMFFGEAGDVQWLGYFGNESLLERLHRFSLR